MNDFRSRASTAFWVLALLAVAGPSWAQTNSSGSGNLFNEVQDDRRLGFYTFTGFDSWRGVADGDWQDNHGLHTGVNVGGPLPMLQEYGLAWQLGGSFGVYDWNGRSSTFPENAATQQQSFITSGLFRRAHEASAWSGGIVLDQMIANNFGVYATEPYLLQLRYQWAYAFNVRNEFGFWGTQELNHATQIIPDFIPFPAATRAVNQFNFFWRHKFDLGADASLYVGAPTNDRIGRQGTLGNLIVGGTFNIPLNDRLAVYSNIAYLNPTSANPDQGRADREDSFNFTLGVSWYPGRNARSRTVAGRTWMPYLPVANNGTFLVDQSVTN